MDTDSHKPQKKNFFSRLLMQITERNPLLEIRETSEIVRYEFKRIILTLKFFIALSFVLLPAIIFLNSIASDYEALLLDFGVDAFRAFSAAGFVNIGQFLLQMIGIMLTLDSFGKVADDSMKRYFALPVRKSNLYIAHAITAFLGTILTGLLGIIVFNLILWIWTGVSLTFLLIVKSFFLISAGAFLAISITTLFVIIANFFGFASSIAIVPTLFIFYIIPFLVNFVTSFAFGLPEAYQWTFMYQLAVATDFMIEPFIGLHNSLEMVANRNAWLIIGIISGVTQILSLIIFVGSEK
ncbi:MAG: hypothetical protein KAX09_09340 [Candidatus Heimdallarchaeota archaeon]|nr:hypothetical protein [Candidatus Heimdallarchaeota archaeon]MCK4291173.1 hypothetical protein [Candidatus Heimdallarchaeota archaeon]